MEQVERLVRATLRGEPAAWGELVLAVAPQIEAIARAHAGMRKRGLAAQVDDLAEVTTATLERMARDGYRNLRRYVEQLERSTPEGAQSFDSWLYGTVDYTIREHLRSRYGRAPRREAE